MGVVQLRGGPYTGEAQTPQVVLVQHAVVILTHVNCVCRWCVRARTAAQPGAPVDHRYARAPDGGYDYTGSSLAHST
jgi:hypothetical protein